MKRIQRLRTNGDFKRALRGRRITSSAFVLHAGSTESLSTTGQVGFIVSKSVGNSVVRHRVTRQLRAIFLTRVDRLNSQDRFVVRALPAITTLPYQQLEEEIDLAFTSAGRA